MASILLQDADENFWQVQIVVMGGFPYFSSQQVAGGTPNVIVLVGDASHHYQLGVDTSGNLDAIPTDAPGINGYVLGSSDCSTGWIITAFPDGNLGLEQILPWNGGPVVGQLFPPDDTLGNYTQPGGIGTPVFPAQPIGEKIGLWTAGCEHWFNAWYIQSATVCGDRSAIITCPVCGYVQQIVTPFDLIYTDAFYIILG